MGCQLALSQLEEKFNQVKLFRADGVAQATQTAGEGQRRLLRIVGIAAGDGCRGAVTLQEGALFDTDAAVGTAIQQGMVCCVGNGIVCLGCSIRCPFSCVAELLLMLFLV